jgi:hypothetical protein
MRKGKETILFPSSFLAVSESETHSHRFIQSAPGGKVNILGGHSIGHSKQKGVNVRVLSGKFPNVLNKKLSDCLRSYSALSPSK